MNNIIKSVSEYVSELLTKELQPGFLFHDLNHTIEVVKNVKEIGSNSGLSEEEMETIIIAAWFHDTGFTVSYLNHEKKSVEIANKFLTENNYSEKKLAEVVRLIEVTEISKSPSDLSEKVLRDADILNLGTDVFFAKSIRLKEERENLTNIIIDEDEWKKKTAEFITNAEFYTEYARKKYDGIRQEHVKKMTEGI